MSNKLVIRILSFFISLVALIFIYLFQEFNYGAALGNLLEISASETTFWVISKLIRFFLNDGFAILMIFALFEEKKYVVFAFLVQILGFIFFLIPYLILSLSFSFQHEASLSYLHRIIMNPTLLMLLIPAFYYQKKVNG